MNFKLKFTKLDIFVIVIITIASLILSFFIYFIPKDTGKSVSIYIEGKNEITLSLVSEKDVVINLYEGDYNPIKLLDENTEQCTYFGHFPSIEKEMKIEVADQKIRVIYSECPAQVCVNQGWVSTPNVPITCTHNRVVVVIESSEAPEIDIIL